MKTEIEQLRSLPSPIFTLLQYYNGNEIDNFNDNGSDSDSDSESDSDSDIDNDNDSDNDNNMHYTTITYII